MAPRLPQCVLVCQFLLVLISCTLAFPFGGGADNSFAQSGLSHANMHANWQDFGGLNKRFGFDNDGLGSNQGGRFVDWSHIISGLTARRGFVKRRFGGDDNGFALPARIRPLFKPKWEFNSEDFKKRTMDLDA